MSDHTLTCTEFELLVPDLLDRALAPETTTAAEVHLAACAACRLLVEDMRRIIADAAALPALAPDRDLWNGIAARIEAPVIPLGGRDAVAGPRPRLAWSMPRLTAAATALVAVTAGTTWLLLQRGPDLASLTTTAAPATAITVKRESVHETMDREITALRTLVAERENGLDSATVAIVEKNLAVIDAAIAESRAALARDPASTFLTTRLTKAYQSKLALLRSIAAAPANI